MSLRKFIKDNLVVIIVLPTIVAVHYGCDRIQHVDTLVTESERKDLPIVRAVKTLKDSILEKYNGFMGEGDKKS